MMSISGSVLGDSKLQRTLFEKVCFVRRSKEGSPDLTEGLSCNGVWQAACFQDLNPSPHSKALSAKYLPFH